MLLAYLKDFFTDHQLVEPKLLLALSGGADSMALFWGLILLRKQGVIFDFSVAHVNHNWRPESSLEAIELKQVAEQQKVTFHLHTLVAPKEQANLEERCRLERLAFFLQLARSEGYTHLILGHHADDQVETVLKRLFEGANLEALGGMRQVASFKELTLLRPLLQMKKQELVSWLKLHQYSYFEDKTNQDTRFLRAKMRHELIPQLSQLFGKQVCSSLLKMADRFEQINNYLEYMLMEDWNRRLVGPCGVALDLTRFKQDEELAVGYLLRKMCRHCDFILSAPQIEQATKAVIEQKAPCCFAKGGGKLWVDRGYAFAVFAKEPLEPYKQPPFTLCQGEYRLGSLIVKVEQNQKEQSQKEKKTASGWQPLWHGCLVCHLPYGSWRIMGRNYLDKPLRRRLEEVQRCDAIPLFLRHLMPVAVGSHGELIDLIGCYRAGLRSDFDPFWRLEIRFAVEPKQQ